MEIIPENVAELLLITENYWSTTKNILRGIMRAKEGKEQRRQRTP